jgi:succinate dehydrogenase / fumarate reductase cytochrome b subunit
MSQMLRPPRVYRRGPWMRLVEGLRYGGGLGQWAWLLHRIAGLGILLYLFFHIIDTFLVVYTPEGYDWILALYSGWKSGQYFWPIRWAFRLGELGLIACVLFHALNGLRVIAFDFWPGATNYHRELFQAVVVVFLVIMIPVAFWIILPLFHAPEPQSPSPMAAVARAWKP